MKTINVAEFK